MAYSFPQTCSLPAIDCYANNPIVGKDEGGPKALRNAAMYLYENCWSNYICLGFETPFNDQVITIPYRQKKNEGTATSHTLTLALYFSSTNTKDEFTAVFDGTRTLSISSKDNSGVLFRKGGNVVIHCDTGSMSEVTITCPANSNLYGIHLYQYKTRASASLGQFENGAWPLDNSAYSYLRPMTPSRYYEVAQLIKTVYAKQSSGQFLNGIELGVFDNYLFAVPLPITRQPKNVKAYFYLRSKSGASSCTITHKQSGESISLSATGTGATDSDYIEVLSVAEGILEPQFDEFVVDVTSENITLVGYWEDIS
jgi:hypothetical protein